MTNFATVMLGSGGFLTTLLSAVPLFFSPPPMFPSDEATRDDPAVSRAGEMANLVFSEPGKGGLFMSFEFIFPDSTGTVEIRLEGDFVEVDETWAATSDSPSRWGARNSRLMFDNREKTLTVINEDSNAYTQLTEAAVDRIREDLSEHLPMEQHSLMSHTAEPPAENEEDRAGDNPTYVVIPEKAHPAECLAYERSLPRGLYEESCYTPWKTAGVKPARLDALKALRHFVRGLDEPLSELGVISAISDALAWDLGLVVSQYKYGKSPLSPGDSGSGLDPWDRIFTLKEVHPHSFKPTDLSLPKSATKEYGIVPWPTPMINL